MVTEKDILEFNDIISIYENSIKELIGMDTIIYIYNEKKNILYSNTFDIQFKPHFNINGIINECFYTKKIHTIFNVINSFLYDEKRDNPLNLNIQNIKVIPIVSNKNKLSGIIYLSSKEINKVKNRCPEIESSLDSISNIINDYNNKLYSVEYKPTILIISSSYMIVKYISTILKKYNFNIISAISVTYGTDEFKSKQIDFVFIDDVIIGLSGSQAIKKLRTIEKIKGEDPVPICGITTDTTKEAKEKILDAGANMVLYKPMTKDDILKTIKLFMF